MIVVSLAVVLVVAFRLRRRLRAPAVTVVLAAAGAALGWGALLLRDDPSAAETALVLVLMAVLVPAHVRIVLGPFGPPRT